MFYLALCHILLIILAFSELLRHANLANHLYSAALALKFILAALLDLHILLDD